MILTRCAAGFERHDLADASILPDHWYRLRTRSSSRLGLVARAGSVLPFLRIFHTKSDLSNQPRTPRRQYPSLSKRYSYFIGSSLTQPSRTSFRRFRSRILSSNSNCWERRRRFWDRMERRRLLETWRRPHRCPTSRKALSLREGGRNAVFDCCEFWMMLLREFALPRLVTAADNLW